MGSINPPKKRDYGKHTRFDTNQSYQVSSEPPRSIDDRSRLQPRSGPRDLIR